jgi:acetolactate synthase-1/2/3 large subunit
MKKFLGAELFFESLHGLGIKTIFGLPGGYVLKIYDVMPSYASKINHILTRHEQAATHMADGFSRASGLPGIILCTSGPAATNTVTGISTAYMDSVPVLIFTGQVPTPFLGSDAFQEADHIGITRSCTKHNTLVRKTKDLPRAIAEALHISNTGRKGPVLVDMPKDVLLGESEFNLPKKISLPNYIEEPKISKKVLNSFKSKLLRSKKPVLVFGRGACYQENLKNIVKILKNFNIPALTSLLSLGVVDSKVSFGMIGAAGSYASSRLIEDSDHIISVGCDIRKILPKSSLIKKEMTIVDIDSTQLDPLLKKNLNINCSSISFIEYLSKDIGNYKTEWGNKYLSQLRIKNNEAEVEEVSKDSKASIFRILSNLLGKSTVICSDFSYKDVNLQRFYKFSDYRNNILSGGNGTPGYGFPAAIGAKFSRPKSKVVSISTGTNFQFNMQEMIVALEQKLDLTIIVLNDKYSNKSMKYKGPDYKSLAESFGAKGYQFNFDSKIEKNLKKTLHVKGLVLIEVRI